MEKSTLSISTRELLSNMHTNDLKKYKSVFLMFLEYEKKEAVKAVRQYPKLKLSRAYRLLTWKTIATKLNNGEDLAKWEFSILKNVYFNCRYQ